MTKHERRVKIAQFCGWVKQPYSGAYWSELYVKDWREFEPHPGWITREPVEVLAECSLANYPKSLDAMHQARQLLTFSQKQKFLQKLCRIMVLEKFGDAFDDVECLNMSYFQSVFTAEGLTLMLLEASADQQSRAFIETIE